MRSSSFRRSWPSAMAGAAVTLVAAAACAPGPGPSADSAAAPATHDPESSRIEVPEPAPRLVAATESGAVVVDPATGETLTTVDTEQRPRLSVAGDGRHVLLNQPDAGTTQILDTGSWSSPHGDHFHHYVAEPGLRESAVEGPNPIHVVSHAGRTAVFHDDDGSATLFDDSGLLIDSIETTEVDSGAPHHGVVVPLEDGALVSVPGPGGLPSGVARVDDDGTEVARFEQCPGLHGEAAIGDTVAFACDTGVMLLTGDDADVLPYPDASGERMGGLATTTGPGGGAEILLGDYAADSLAVVDPGQAAIRVLPLGSAYGPYTLGPHAEVLVLTTDGTLRVLDPATGTETGAVRAVDPFELPEGHGGVAPSLSGVGHTVYVADPAGSSIVPVDLETLGVGEPITLDAAPTDLVAVGTGGQSAHSGH